MGAMVNIDIATSRWKRMRVSAERPMFVIGDVHGHADHLRALHDQACKLIVSEGYERACLVHIGDLIDRGPDSLGAIDAARRGLNLPGIEQITLLGNHEQMFLLSVLHSDPGSASDLRKMWLRDGGDLVMAELGLQTDASAQAIIEALGTERFEFLHQARTYFAAGDILCIHAGLHPRRAPNRELQRNYLRRANLDWDSPLWVREEFLEHQGPLHGGFFVVHGHSIEEDGPILRPHRLGIDVGSYRTGRVCMVEIFGNAFRAHVASRADRSA